ncbi:MAG: DUF3717 domain-containing protein [Rhodoferax sp.]|nr:DUF3717 domain-containing protein [Rhodoferax sp.]
MAYIHITDLESAINFWRANDPVAPTMPLSPSVNALAEVYGRMAFAGQSEIDEILLPAQALAAWMVWYATTPDTPCIAICSTSQGDDWCKGCGRSFEEVQNWTGMRPADKRQTWRRIVAQGTAWRFNRYAERANGRATEPPESPSRPLAR